MSTNHVKASALLCVLILVSACHGASYWKNLTGDQLWSNGANWEVAVLPAPTSSTALSWNMTSIDQYAPTLVPSGDVYGQRCRLGQNAGRYGHIIVDGGNAAVREIEVGDYGTGVLDVKSGTFATTLNDISIGDEAGSTGTLNLEGGTVTAKRFMNVGKKGSGTLDMDGGVLNVTQYDLQIGDAGGDGVVDMSGGEINCNRHLKVGGGSGTGRLTITGGVINAPSYTYVPETSSSSGVLELFGGTINTGTLSMLTGSLVNVTAGTLIVDDADGSAKTQLDAKVSSGQIVGYDGYGTVSVVWDGSSTSTVTAVGPDADYALSPAGVTVDGSDPNLALSWKAGVNATQHTVYFGTSETAVINREVGVNQGLQTSPFIIGTQPAGTPFFWTVDASDGVTTWPGEVVSFSTQSLSNEATNLSPTDPDAPVDSDLSWTDGMSATEHRVYFSTEEQAVINRDAAADMGLQTSPYDVIAGDMPYRTPYFWTVDAGDGVTTWPGTVVTFTTAGPTPPSSARWDNDSGDQKWETLANWDSDIGAGVQAYINLFGDANEPIIGAGVIANEVNGATGFVRIAENADDTGSLLVDGGELEAGQFVAVGYRGKGTLKINSGTVETLQYDIETGTQAGSDGLLEMSDGTLTAARRVVVGARGDGVMKVSGGTVTSGSGMVIGAWADTATGRLEVSGSGEIAIEGKELRVGSTGPGELIMTGGTVSCATLNVPFRDYPPYDKATGHVDLHGGTLTVSSLQVVTTGTMDITEGVLIVNGDQEELVLETYADRVYAYGGAGIVSAVYDDGTETTTVTGLPPDPSVIETFETYVGEDPNALLFAVWSEGGGASISITQNVVYVAQQALQMRYEGSALSTAQMSLDLDIDDVTSFDAKALSLHFRGMAGNEQAGMSMTLSSPGQTATVDYDGAALLSDEEWVEWNVALSDFVAGGVDLNDITGLTITIGDSGTAAAGSMYFDQITLKPVRCLPELAIGELTGDCIVDLSDFAIMDSDWQMSGYDVVPTAPSSVGLVLHYMMDDTGLSVTDETGSYNGSTVPGNWQSSGGYDGGRYITFDGTNYIDVPADALSTVASTGAVTVSVWVRGDDSESLLTRQILFSARTIGATGHILTMNIPNAGGESLAFESGHVTPQEPDWEWWYYGWDTTSWQAEPEDFRGSWSHFAFTKDLSTGLQKMYHNGQLVGMTRGATAPIETVGVFIIGGFSAPSSIMYHGDVDEFRIYDRALAHGEVLSLAGGSGFHQSVLSEADFDGSDVVGIDDLNIMLNRWLEEQLWPED